MQIPERPIDHAEAFDQFVAINGLVGELSNQNYRIAEALEDEIDDLEFQELVVDDVITEQRDTLALLSKLTAHAPYEQLAEMSLHEAEKPLSELRAEINALFDEAGKAWPVPYVTQQPRTESEAEPESELEPAAPHDTKNNWRRDFRQRVGNAIDELSDQGLIKPEPMTAYAASLLSKSRNLGTETAVQRLIDVGIINRPGNVKLGRIELDAAEIVAMHLLNPQRDILGLSNRNRQRQAIKILRESVASYLDKQRDQ